MNVKDCVNCKHFELKSYIQFRHPIGERSHGFTHTYHYCNKHQKRCRAVYKCEERETEWNKEKD